MMKECRILKDGRVIFPKVKVLKGIIEKSRGLMLKRELKDDEALLFRFGRMGRHGFHMFLVFFPIDIIWLNERMEIVEIHKNFRPFSYYSPKCLANNVIEMRKGSISRFNLSLGDGLTVSYPSH